MTEVLAAIALLILGFVGGVIVGAVRIKNLQRIYDEKFQSVLHDSGEELKNAIEAMSKDLRGRVAEIKAQADGSMQCSDIAARGIKRAVEILADDDNGTYDDRIQRAARELETTLQRMHAVLREHSPYQD